MAVVNLFPIVTTGMKRTRTDVQTTSKMLCDTLWFSVMVETMSVFESCVARKAAQAIPFRNTIYNGREYIIALCVTQYRVHVCMQRCFWPHLQENTTQLELWCLW